MSMEYSRAQQAVISNRGGSLLVSAAAGSGKTSVLVDRLLDRVELERHNIDTFLIITFTKAAAEELRTRIFRALSKRIKNRPDDHHLQRQTMLLYHTQISTIHSLCTVLLREWGHMVDVPVDFALCDEEDTGILMLQTLQDLLESRYETVTPGDAFAQLLDILSAGRDDRRLIEIVLDVYSRMQSHPDPNGWMEAQKPLFRLEGIRDAGETTWGKLLLEDTGQVASYWENELTYAITLAEGDPSLSPYLESLGTTLEQIQALIAAVDSGWDAVCDCPVTFPRLKPVRSCEDTNLQEQIKSVRARCKEAMEKLSERFENRSKELLEDIQLIAPAMMGLFDLVKDFSTAYGAAKSRRSLLDFADLEHKTVALLVDEEGRPTEIAKEVGGRFLELMVDEYQDTNQVQNAIFDALSDDGKNLFMVGDVKQSIYRFRLADPTIFLEKYRRFSPYEQAREGTSRKILLSQNFRSRPQVLEAVNDLFRSIMSEQLGEMNYTEEEALYAGGTFPEGDGYETELHVLDFKELSASAESAQKPGNHALEARFAATQAARLLRDGFQVADGEGGKRSAVPEDIAILLRAPGSVRHHYVKALEEVNLPWAAEEDGGLFETAEVQTMLSFLQIIDNPRQDVPLVSVLHSPLFGFDGEHLSKVRQLSKEDLYTALQQGAEAGIEDCRAFLEQLDSLRFGAGELSCHGLLWKLYQDTNALEIFSRMPQGDQREENLLSFYELACRFERNGHRGLFGFLRHLEKLKESGRQVSKGGGGEQSGVKILSIHRSKGLEYPIVFLCGLGKRFNYSDVQKPVLFHTKLGLGPRGLDSERMVEFQTLPRQAVALQLKREMLAEEMRLLYVAMTRAKEKLIMTQVLPYGASDLAKLAPYASAPVDPNVLSGCSSVGQWLLLAAMSRPEGAVLRRLGGAEEILGGEAHFPWIIQHHTGLPEVSASEVRQPVQSAQFTQDTGYSQEEIWRLLHWTYPFERMAATPAKLTATQLTSDAHLDAPPMALDKIEPEEARSFHRPQFAAERLGLTPAQRGTAYHTVLQNIRFEETHSMDAIETELKRLTEKAYLTEQEASAVSPQKLHSFFQSRLGVELRQATQLYREFPFSILAPAEIYYDEITSGEQILLQGVIDCWFETEQGITLLDFKTNQISKPQAIEKAIAYQAQLNAYAYALEEITGRPVHSKIIWFISPNCGVITQPEGRLKILER